MIALSNQAAWLAFLTDRLPGRVLHRRSIADVLACTERAQSRSSFMPGFLVRDWLLKLVVKVDEGTII